MRLKNCHIENFGKLKNFDYNFFDGLNVINQENGFGKTTFATFIKAMFYGLPSTTKRNLDENERKKYMPWQGENFGGNIVFEVDGRTYKIQRFFGKNNSEDAFELYDIKTGKQSTDFSQNIGEELFGLDCDAFERSAFSSQKILGSNVNESISNKFRNTIQGVSEEFNFEKAIEILNNKRVRLYNNKNSGEIQSLEAEIEKIEQDIRDIGSSSVKIDILSQSIEEDDLQIQKLQKDIDFVKTQIKQYSVVQQNIANKEMLNVLNGQIKSLQEQEKNANLLLNGVNIDEKSVDLQILNNQNTENKETILKTKLEISYVEEKNLELSEYFKNGAPTEDEIAVAEKNAQLVEKKYSSEINQNGIKNGSKKYFSLFNVCLLVLGIVGVVLGAFMANNSLVLAIVLIGLGVICFLGFAFLYFKNMINNKFEQNRIKIDESNLESFEDAKKQLKSFIEKYENSDNFRTALSKIIAKKDEFFEVKKQVAKKEQEVMQLKEQIEQEKMQMRKFLNQFVFEAGSLKAEDKLLLVKQAINQKAKIQEELAEKQNEFENFKKDKNILENVELKGEDIVQLQKKESDLQRDIDKLKEDRSMLVSSISAIQNELSGLNDLEIEKDNRVQKLKKLKTELMAVKNAKKYLEQANESLTSKFLQPMKSGLKKYLKLITGIEFENLHLDTDFNVAFDEYGKIRELDFYSKGYKNIVDICLRLALIDALFDKQKPFVILDDPFINFDEKKVQNTKTFLNELAKEYQVIYFTCHSSRC